MMSSEDADYVCTLDQVSIKKAKEELNENPQDRLAAVQALREWIQAQPHIDFPNPDTITMLKFLRGAKFSQVRARELIEGNLSLKYKAPEMFKDIDTLEDKVKKIMDTGYIAPLPKRTPQGCQILVYRMGKLKIKDFDMKSLMRAASAIVEYISQSEDTQVNGTVFLFDFTGIDLKFASKMLVSDTKKWQTLWQKNTPGRFKGFHYYNVGLIFETMMAFARPFMPKKFIDRIKTHDTMETLYKEIPMECLPQEYLPDDYDGPSAGPIDEIVKNFLSAIRENSFRETLKYKTSTAYSIDESKKSIETVTGHFRKLNVD